ncbi:asparaginase domain-containing protein [Corynebacterium sp. H128]|uniref:asparaginase n=1 Tax=unclassified Corynebacterium TaxID=2624378 RepID=UPI0030AE0047
MDSQGISRRRFLAGSALATTAGLLAACSSGTSETKAEAKSSETAGAGSKTDYKSISGKLVMLATGGTIASQKDASGALVPTVSGEELLKKVYEKFDKSKLSIEVRQVSQLDSSAMTLKDTDNILKMVHETLKEDGVTGIIVSHGTDSMEESAIAIDTFLDTEQPVVLTGSMFPFDDPDTDGPDNLTLAVTAATDPKNKGKGAFIAFGGKILHARGAFKMDASSKDGFDTNAKGDVKRPKALELKPLDGTRVDIIAAYPGAPGELVKAAVDSGAKGLVIEGMGSGNVGGAIADAIVDAAGKGIPVVMSTRVDKGLVEGTYGGAGGGATLAEKGVIGSGILRPGQSRILVVAALATGTDVKELFPQDK